MSGVWTFKTGSVVDLVGKKDDQRPQGKVLVHKSTNEVVTSYGVLEEKLLSLGWERYNDDPDLFQFHKKSTVHLISLPKDFHKFNSAQMYDIVIKNPNDFEVRDV